MGESNEKFYLEDRNYGDKEEYEHVFDSSLGHITGKDVIAHLNPLRSKPRVFCISLVGKFLVFPVKEVDKYLKRIDKFSKRITSLTLQFDVSNSVELLDMVVARFPHLEQLFINYSREHPIEHGLKRLAQLPKLYNTDFPFRMQNVMKYIQTHQFTPFPEMLVTSCPYFNPDDEYSHYEATLPVLFPNLTKLMVACTGKVLEDLEANIRTLMPKLDLVETIDLGGVDEEKQTPDDVEDDFYLYTY